MYKKWFLIPTTIVILFIGLLISGCRKVTVPISSQWTVNGNTYYGGRGGYIYPDSVGVIFYGMFPNNDLTNELDITFGKYPYSAGTYKIVNYPPTDTSCVITLLLSAPSNAGYTSTGKIGDSLHISIDSGKVTMSFTNISMQNIQIPNDTTLASAILTSNPL